MRRCADFLLAHFADKAVPGRWAKSVAFDGKVIDGGFHAYAHTHVIFALAHVYQATQDKRYLQAALHTWVHLNVPGVLAGRERGLAFNKLNFTMHCFESLLVLQKAAASTMVRDDLRVLGQHIVTHFPDLKHGFFYESLDKNYKPVTDGEIRLGHNAEMAFLLGRAADAGLPSQWLTSAQRLIDFVVAQGIARDGSLPHELDYSFRVKDATLVWWAHAEMLRSLAYFAWHHGRMDLKPVFAKSLAYVKLHFIDPVHGGWYWNADRPDMPKGGDWNAGYHVAMMLTEILRLGRTRFVSGQEVLL
jgi:mannose/cellobiose epimerase-like protein (N-acyl-D-glucosamine 2-epimerase family)